MSEAFWVGCRRGPRHAFGAGDMTLRTSDQRDPSISIAQASDEEAVRWLGLREETIEPPEVREEMLALAPGGLALRDERWLRRYVVEVEDEVVGEVQLTAPSSRPLVVSAARCGGSGLRGSPGDRRRRPSAGR